MIRYRDRATLRRNSVPAFIRKMAERHPEMREPVTYEGFQAIAAREHITVMHVRLSRPARLLRLGGDAFIQIHRSLSVVERTKYGMHELSHFWRDDPGFACYNVEDDAFKSPAEEFADIFAWVATSPARIFLPGLRNEDF